MDETTIVIGAFDQPTIRYTDTYASCSSSSYSTSASATKYAGVVVTKKWSRCKTPRFYTVLEQGGLLPYNQYSVSTVTESKIVGDEAVHYQKPDSCTAKQWLVRQRGGTLGDFPFTLIDPGINEDIMANVVNAAVAMARGNVFDTLTFLAEFERTKDMFRTNVNRIGNIAARAAGRAQRSARKHRLPDFHKYWLEYRYGWLPLIGSMRDAVEAIQNGQVRAFGRSRQTDTFSDTTQGTAPGTIEDFTWSETLNVTREYRGWATATASGMSTPSLGLDPLLTGWEVVPYSFVIDWFIPIGTWLQAVSPLQAGSTSGSGCSIKTTLTKFRTESRSWHRQTGSTTNHWGSGSAGQHIIEEESYTRIPMGVSLPGWNPRITPTRMLDAVALIMAQKARIFRMLRK